MGDDVFLQSVGLPSKARLLGIDLVRDAFEKVKMIQERVSIAQFREKNYSDRKVRDVAFIEGEKVLLRVSPMKGVMRFGKMDKLIPRYIGPFEVLERVGEMSYILSLPPNLLGVHPVFHVYMLQKYYEDPLHVLDFSSVQLDENMAYEEESVAISDRKVQKLRSKNIALVKVQWRGQPIEEATWETGHNMGADILTFFISQV
ncbi:uncharacterized protein [Nicotiana tomentosiformis]|uniref:uncharacterized protein n=1 Tax=Nicotiana tomentosiformis TaxID=4098 RepID=UPI00388C9D45